MSNIQENKKDEVQELLDYSLEVLLVNKLFKEKAITEIEYNQIKIALKNDYEKKVKKKSN